MARGDNTRFNAAQGYLMRHGILPPEYLQGISLTADEEFSGSYPALGGSFGDATSRLEALVNQHKLGSQQIRPGFQQNQQSVQNQHSAAPMARKTVPGSGLAPEELFESAYKMLARDREAFSRTGYTQYPGRNASPMSTATQRARELRTESIGAHTPYSNRIQSVLGRQNEGLSTANIASLLNMLKEGQNRTKDTSLGELSKQFQSSENTYAPRVDRYNRKASQDLERGLLESQGSLKTLGQALGTTDASRNLQLTKSLRGLQDSKEWRREELIGNLQQFGAQKHAYNNKVIGAEKRLFEDELKAPQERMDRLQHLLDGHKGGIGEGAHPDMESSRTGQVIQGLRAYGVDPSRSPDQWSTSRNSRAPYRGQAVADLTPEMKDSYEMLERLDPKMKDSFSTGRKALVSDLLKDQGLADQAMRGLPESLRGPLSQLDYATQQKVKQDLGEITNKYVKMGSYGSSQHRRDAENRVRSLNQSAFEQRDKTLQSTLTSDFVGKHNTDLAKIKRLDEMGVAGQKERMDLFGKIRKLNQLGADQWSNNQDENEDIYKNYVNQGLWEWPHMRNQTKREARGEIFQGLADRNIGLDQLASLNTRHSEVERERDTLRRDLTTAQSARAELERRMSLANAETTRRQAAEAQSRATAEAAARGAQARATAERARLAQISSSSSSRSSPQDERAAILKNIAIREARYNTARQKVLDNPNVPPTHLSGLKVKRDAYAGQVNVLRDLLNMPRINPNH